MSVQCVQRMPDAFMWHSYGMVAANNLLVM
jgi:hypothetical protein